MRNPEDTELTRKDIIDAFWEFYEVKPIEKITVRQVIERAGYNRTTFYYHFADIYDVRRQVEMRIHEQAVASWPVDVTDPKNFFDPGIMDSYFERVFVANERYVRVLLGEHGHPLFAQEMMESVKGHFSRVIEEMGMDPESEFSRQLLEFYATSWLSVLRMYYGAKDAGVSIDVLDLFQALGEKIILPTAEKGVEAQG